MKVIVDTCIWSLALRRNNVTNSTHIAELQKLIEDSRIQMLGPIRQELLSGISSPSQFKKLKNQLAAFPDIMITTENYELAAEYFNLCRARGIQGSSIDFLICATATYYACSIFTNDHDFIEYAKIIPIVLYQL